MSENSNDKQKKELNKVKYYYINKVNKIRRLTSQLMNKINNNTTLSNNIYTKEMYKLQQLEATFELLDAQLCDLKNTMKYYEDNNKDINNNNDNNYNNKKINNGLLKFSELDILFPIVYSLFNNNNN